MVWSKEGREKQSEVLHLKEFQFEEYLEYIGEK